MQEKIRNKGGNPRFIKGQSGNPAGKPKGTKNKIPTGLKEKVLFACEQLEKKGKDLATVAQNKPEWFYETFVKPMLPKDMTIRIISSWSDLSEDEKAALLAEAAQIKD